MLSMGDLSLSSMLLLVGALWLALAIDRWLGEPSARWHPVVWMGAYLGWVGAFIAPQRAQTGGPDYKCFGLGALAWLAGAALVLIVTVALQQALLQLPALLSLLLLGLLLKPLLAWRMLRGEVLAVEAALAESLPAGRARLAWLVSRDVQTLSEAEVRESAIESLAENLNDSVVAPIFWFVLLGLPGAALYRFANTADAMWGYRGIYNGRDWAWAGKWAARADDVLSWLPARLTAWLLALVHGGLSLRAMRREAGRTPSPNSGWPMAAMALALGVSLHKPGVYVLNGQGRAPLASDTARAAVLGSKVVLAFAMIATAAIVFIAFSAQEVRP
ncbi:MAG: adenosylcobinamide-phosphate synthase CbiB [Hylemonella sp.]|nr:adenosylcobinamide-phosphate synthase CbiB [Hylemonella sp.]MDP1936012.1 adenosylcobinamide-phosphate synthase CbiB [Hylemonella sp.]